jgi:putative endonuclease
MKLGTRGERVGAKFLKRLGYRILETNYTCALGEVDIIALDGDMIVFVEVKTRQSDQAADPENAVNFHKRKQITRTARWYLSTHNLQNVPARFDILAILIPATGKPTIEHFIDAFAPTPR